jgi:uncharacterized protein YbjQ (UPF0145 family)
MIITTTFTVEGKKITAYKGIVTGETIFGANFVKDFFASVRDFFGGRSRTYEKTIDDARTTSFAEMTKDAEAQGANAIVGVSISYQTIGEMIMVTTTGTAVVVE